METPVLRSVKNELLTYIQQHLDAQLSLKRLAQFTGYSSFYLHRLMKDELEEPLGNYIKRKRIETAASLLGLTRYSVSEIRELVGYQNDAAFSKAFRQVMGCSPREFRKQDFFKLSAAGLPGDYLSLNYRIERLKDWQALSFPSLQNYFSTSLQEGWAAAAEYIAKDNMPAESLSYWGVVHECPNITGNVSCRYDAALAPVKGPVPIDLFNTCYRGGKFAVFTFCMPHAGLKEVSLQISRYILTQTKLSFREGASYFKYAHNPRLGLDYLLTDWYIPVA